MSNPMRTEVLHAARFASEFPYAPVVIADDPAEALAELTKLAAEAGGLTDAGLRRILREATEITWTPSRRDMTDAEAAAAEDMLSLLWELYSKTPHQIRDRAQAWVAQTDPVTALAVISVGIQLLQFIDNMQPGVLDRLA